MLCQLGPRGASSDAGAQRTTRDKYGESVGCSAAKGPGRLRDDRLFSSDDITILVHEKWGFATTDVYVSRAAQRRGVATRAKFSKTKRNSKLRTSVACVPRVNVRSIRPNFKTIPTKSVTAVSVIPPPKHQKRAIATSETAPPPPNDENFDKKDNRLTGKNHLQCLKRFFYDNIDKYK